MKYPHLHISKTNLNETRFLKKLVGLLDNDISVYMAAESKLTRTNLDGLWLIKGTINNAPVAVIWNDYRVKGGSFGKSVSDALVAFLNHESICNLPLILGVNSLGYRFMEGRQIFNSVFGMVPAVIEHKKKNLVLTMCFDQCFGMGALLFGLGHYRIAVEENTSINLAGPDVFKMFFGEKCSFEDATSSKVLHMKTDMVSETARTLELAKDRIKILFKTFLLKDNYFQQAHKDYFDFILNNTYQPTEGEKNLNRLLSNVVDERLEIFNGYTDRFKVFICRIDGEFFGVLANPLKNINNMFTYRELCLYHEAIKLFEFLQLPVVSMLDTPGVDPRIDGNNHLIISKLICVNDAIISYPFPKMGIFIGRGFGGANTLVMPKIYGSLATYVLDVDTDLNIMHESIIKHLLKGSTKLLEQWEKMSAKEGSHFEDMIESGNIDGVIKESEVKGLIKKHLLIKQPYETRFVLSHNSEINIDEFSDEEVALTSE
jgi:acetyl-CoA carboxylase carboxyltransferase component